MSPYRLRILPLVLLAAACGSEDNAFHGVAAVAGTYSVALTNSSNSCALPNFELGTTSQGVPVEVTQDGATASARIDGIAGGFLRLWLGTAQYDGSVEESAVDLTARGSTPLRQGRCTYTVDSRLQATLTGDSLSGTLTYTPHTNGDPDCAQLLDCSAAQRFAGSRPPPP